ncbi:MAG TPA: sigma-70 family RNA polymerase sigma factor [Gemmatimonadaceae bacterium]|nr:sigma-70 family RNA polymerase sigma factor [Gemmatimonadaceae bacterium]
MTHRDASTPSSTPSTSPPGAATQLLLAWSAGDRNALDQMLPLLYEELHRLASGYLGRERPDHTLQPTALVHEAYLRLINQRHADWRNRAQFLGLAAGMMRRILVNHARDRAAAKRAGNRERVSLSLVDAAAAAPDVDLIALEDALGRLSALDERKARVVELRFFGGLTMDEIAEVLEISRATVEREWSFARAWLYDAIEGTADADAGGNDTAASERTSARRTRGGRAGESGGAQ